MSRVRLSANLGYLWNELPFLNGIRRAAETGFHAVEFHDQGQREDRRALKDVLSEVKLPVVGLNVRMGETMGCAAIPEAGDQAKADIAAAIDLAEDIDAGAIHVLAGKTAGQSAQESYLKALSFALENTRLTVLIEPICEEQLPGYFLQTIEQADQVLSEMNHPQLKIMFDCYHIHRQSGALLERFQKHAHQIGHVQIASAEGRMEPFPGDLDYDVLLPAFRQAGYDGPIGCEYRPQGTTDEGLVWRNSVSSLILSSE